MFETWLKVKLHQGKTLSLRITGTVEAPKVFIDLVRLYDSLCIHTMYNLRYMYMYLYTMCIYVYRVLVL